MIKVLYILDSLNRGGTETFVLDICRNARENGIDLTLVTTGGGTLENEFRESGVDQISLNRRLPIDIKVAYRLRKIVRERGIEIIHTHQAVEGIHAYIAHFGTKAKVVLSFHGGHFDSKNKKALDFLIPKMSRNIYVSESLRKWYSIEKGLDSDKNYTVLYNGVDTKRLVASKGSIRTELGLGEDVFLMGMTGNFHGPHRKDQITICKALPKVLGKFENAHFIFAGGIARGGEKNFEDCVAVCRDAGITDRVHFLGERNDVPDILASLDLFVLSSFLEGMPIAVIEAMLVGVPVILSDIEPLLEISGNGKYGVIFKAGNAEDLADKMLGLMEDGANRDSLAEDARSFANENYTIEAHFENLKQLYNSVLKRS